MHGSAPDIAGKDLANPLAMIMSAAMMCKYDLNIPMVRMGAFHIIFALQGLYVQNVAENTSRLRLCLFSSFCLGSVKFMAVHH